VTGTVGRRVHRRLIVTLLLVLVCGAGLVRVAGRDAPAPAARLAVVPAGRYPAIEERAIGLVTGLATGARPGPAGSGRTSLSELRNAPAVVGLVEVRPGVALAGIRDDVVVRGIPTTVYTVVTLLGRDGSLRPAGTSTACDRSARGLAFSVPLPGGPALVVLGARQPGRVPWGSLVEVDPAAPMAAWTDGRLDPQQSAVAALADDGDGRCTPAQR